MNEWELKAQQEKMAYADQANYAAQIADSPINSKPYYGDQCGVQAVGAQRPSLRQEAEQQVGYHRQQAEKHDQAAAFFRENPAFDEFIRLIRAGAIQI